MASLRLRFVARNEIVLKIDNLRAFPKGKNKEAGFAVGDPLAILFRFHCPSISKVSAAMFFQATFVGQTKGKTIQSLRGFVEVFVPPVERDRVMTRSGVEANLETSVRRRQDSD